MLISSDTEFIVTCCILYFPSITVSSINYEIFLKQNVLVETIKDFRKNSLRYHVRALRVQLRIVLNLDNLSLITEHSCIIRHGAKQIEVTAHTITAPGISQSFFLLFFLRLLTSWIKIHLFIADKQNATLLLYWINIQ